MKRRDSQTTKLEGRTQILVKLKLKSFRVLDTPSTSPLSLGEGGCNYETRTKNL